MYYNTFKSLMPDIIDLTPLLLLISSVLIVQSFVNYGLNLRHAFILLFVAVQVFPAIYNITNAEYNTKFARLMLITIPPMLLAASIEIDIQRIKIFSKYLRMYGYIILGVCLLYYLTNNGDITRGGFDAPILVARSILIFALLMIHSSIHGYIKPKIGIPISVLSIGVAVVSGSRGPLVAFLIAMLILVASTYRNSRSNKLMVSVLSAFILSVYLLPSPYTTRLSNILSGSLDVSSLTRLEAWQAAASAFSSNIFGHGLGSFSNENIYSLLGYQYIALAYPHNFLFEGAYESGVLFLVLIFITIIAISLHLALNKELGLSWIFPLLVFSLINACVSSDIPGNRELWILTVLAIPRGITYFIRSRALSI